MVPAGNRLTALISSWRSSSFQPLLTPLPALAFSELRAACCVLTSASRSRCSCAFTSCTYTTHTHSETYIFHMCMLEAESSRSQRLQVLNLRFSQLNTIHVTVHFFWLVSSNFIHVKNSFLTCFSMAARLSSLPPEAKSSFNVCKLEKESKKRISFISDQCIHKEKKRISTT